MVRHLLTGPPLRLPVLPNWLDGAAGGAIAIAYLVLSWAATGGRRAGRSPGRGWWTAPAADSP